MSALSQTAGNVLKSSGTSKNGTSGGTLTAGMPVYRDVSDSNKLKACRANVSGTANCDGILLCGGSSGQPITYVESPGVVNLGATLAVGETYCVSDAAAGAIVPIGDLGSADYVTILGVATSTSLLKLDIINSATAKA